MDILIKICQKSHCLQQILDTEFVLVKVIGRWVLVHQGGLTIRNVLKYTNPFNTLHKIYRKEGHFKKLDGVGPVDNRPSNDLLHLFAKRRRKKNHS